MPSDTTPASPPLGSGGARTGAAKTAVTVAVCTWNRAPLLRETLACITRQDYPPELLQIIVIDNNSTDDTRFVVTEFVQEPHVPRHCLEANQGLDHARNRAIAEARGEYIIFADDDILVESDWVRQLIAPFTSDGGRSIGCVGGEVIPIFPDGAPDWVRAWHQPLAFRPDAGPLPPPHSPMGANFAFPQWIFSQIGPFASGLDRSGRNLFGGGDAEIIRRVRAAGFEVWFAPAAKVRHQMPRARTTFRYTARHAFDSARSRTTERAGAPGAGAWLLSRFLLNLCKAVLFALLSLLLLLLLNPGRAQQALVRAWRACGYLWQIPRSLAGIR